MKIKNEKGLDMYYKLEGKKIVSCSFEEFSEFFGDIKNRRVAQDYVDKISISTVFLGIDHNFGGSGTPVLFETMVFGGEHDEYCQRYHTWQEAEEGHKEIVKMVQGFN